VLGIDHRIWLRAWQMRFNPDLSELIPKEQLDADFGGEYEFEFEPETYWEQVVACVSIYNYAFLSMVILGLCVYFFW
jgi:hypothetical protein